MTYQKGCKNEAKEKFIRVQINGCFFQTYSERIALR